VGAASGELWDNAKMRDELYEDAEAGRNPGKTNTEISNTCASKPQRVCRNYYNLAARDSIPQRAVKHQEAFKKE